MSSKCRPVVGSSNRKSVPFFARDWRELLPLCCHPAEQADFQDAADAQGRVRLLRLWTAKEAYLKGRGEGLSLPLTAIRLSTGDGWQARIEAPWDAGQGWWLHALALPAGYLGCLATPFPSPLIRFQSLAELTSSARVESPLPRSIVTPKGIHHGMHSKSALVQRRLYS